MCRWFLVLTLMLLSALTGSRGGMAQDLAMVTGGAKGTYIQIGKNISELVAPGGIALEVRESSGSIENVSAIRWTPGVQIGIVQSDVLEVLRMKAAAEPANRERLLDLVKRIKMVFPLYNEEIHILARSGIESLADLHRKRVAFGPVNSGSYVTSLVVFQLAGIKPDPYTYGYDEALEALRRGELDAMVYVIGEPASFFKEKIRDEDDFVFVPIDDPGLLHSGLYVLERLEPESYPWLTNAVQTVAVKAVLAAYDYHGENCQHIGKLAALVYQGLDELKQTGHDKWNAVNLDQELPSWDTYSCVREALSNIASVPDEPSDSENLRERLR